MRVGDEGGGTASDGEGGTGEAWARVPPLGASTLKNYLRALRVDRPEGAGPSRAGPARTLRAEGGADFARRACAAVPVAGGPEMFLAPCLLGSGEKSGETAPEKSGEG